MKNEKSNMKKKNIKMPKEKRKGEKGGGKK
jgi:hypothetical protein